MSVGWSLESSASSLRRLGDVFEIGIKFSFKISCSPDNEEYDQYRFSGRYGTEFFDETFTFSIDHSSGGSCSPNLNDPFVHELFRKTIEEVVRDSGLSITKEKSEYYLVYNFTNMVTQYIRVNQTLFNY